MKVKISSFLRKEVESLGVQNPEVLTSRAWEIVLGVLDERIERAADEKTARRLCKVYGQICKVADELAEQEVRDAEAQYAAQYYC